MKKELADLIGKKSKWLIGTCVITAGIAGAAIVGSFLGGEAAKTATSLLEIEAENTKVVQADALVSDVLRLKEARDFVDSQIDWVSGYKLVVDNRIELLLPTKEDLERTLELVQKEHLDKDLEPDVAVVEDKDAISIECEVEEQLPVLMRQDVDRELSTASILEAESKTVSEGKYILAADDLILNEEEAKKQEEEKDLNANVRVSFNEDIAIEKVTAESEEFTTPDEAAAILNKTNVEPEQYVVQNGDSPYSIALDYDMSLDDIYALNDGLKEKAKSLQVGESVTVEKIQPELSVTVEKKVVYYDTIPRETEYIDDDTIFETVESITEAGYDGTKEVTAMVSTVDGIEIGREILSETVVSEPKSTVIHVGTKPLPEKGAIGNFKYPLSDCRISSPYGWRSSGFHTGVDFVKKSGKTYGSSIQASDGGTVKFAGWSGNYGNLVIIDHGDGRVTKYAHCSKILVSEGQLVGQGETIAKVGSTGNSTGPHVHFEILLDGETVNPMDYLE